MLLNSKRPWCWERLKAGGEGDNRGWDGWMASLTRWTWVWVSSGSWGWTGNPGLVQSMGSQRVRHNWETELNWSRVWLLCDPMEYSPPAPSPHWIFQARILEWVLIPFSRGSSWPRDCTCVSCTGKQVLYHFATWEVYYPLLLSNEYGLNVLSPQNVNWSPNIQLMVFGDGVLAIPWGLDKIMKVDTPWLEVP